MRTLLRQMSPALIVLAAFTVITGLAYPLAVTAISHVAFRDAANGSILRVDGQAVGSKLLGQQFASPRYFHPRPSAAGTGYDGSASGGSNLGPNNPALLDAISERVAAFRRENGLGDDALVPADAVTASASGLDPHISVANTRLQAPRVARSRSLPIDRVFALIKTSTADRPLKILGDQGVNVLELNVALDREAA